MRRRDVLAGLLLATAVQRRVKAQASQSGKVYRIAVLTAHPRRRPEMDGLRDGLRDLGYVEGRNLVLDWRYAERGPDQLPELAAELVALRPNLIVSFTTLATQAVQAATRTLPVVFANVGDPVATGFVASLARPGGNLTGLSTLHADLSGKRLEVLKEVRPEASLVAVLWNGNNAAARLQWQHAQDAAPALGLRLLSLDVQRAEGIAGAFATAAERGADGLLVEADLLTASDRHRVVELAARHRLPTVYPVREFTIIGGLMSYGLNLREHYRAAATVADKVLKGAKPADLPVEQPTRFELVINQKTAATLGLTVPPALLARADEVIE